MLKLFTGEELLWSGTTVGGWACLADVLESICIDGMIFKNTSVPLVFLKIIPSLQKSFLSKDLSFPSLGLKISLEWKEKFTVGSPVLLR